MQNSIETSGNLCTELGPPVAKHEQRGKSSRASRLQFVCPKNPKKNRQFCRLDKRCPFGSNI